eukprot:1137183-Pelagomonas_calceolata.AAC.2
MQRYVHVKRSTVQTLSCSIKTMQRYVHVKNSTVQTLSWSIKTMQRPRWHGATGGKPGHRYVQAACDGDGAKRKESTYQYGT